MNTVYEINFDWWSTRIDEYENYVWDFLCDQHKQELVNVESCRDTIFDLIDVNTGLVSSVGAVEYYIRMHCFDSNCSIKTGMTMIDSMFLALFANGNTPMTVKQLAAQIGRDTQYKTISRMFSGGKIHKGITSRSK
tara:strand:+ start:290 stop:697 length:408 start_codon:yes stop_codon:yes gene_type:complete